MATVTAPTIWARALHRAEAHNILVTFAGSETRGFDETLFYKVASASRPGTIHGVKIETSADGVRTMCSCEAGQRGSVCLHQAKALRDAGLLPDLMLIESEEEAREELRIDVVDPMAEAKRRAMALLMGKPVA